ncbi:MAG: AMP nucleosidase [Geminicoccaceae bacterium]|nr:AMP nucleosidase [Geminicoccaceae bacterium]MCB9943142.1 AMP nucleosidase [Geminicoccaceae bacterium]
MSDDILEPFKAFGITDLTIEKDAGAAVERLRDLYDRAGARLKDAFIRYAVSGEEPGEINARYPYVGLRVAAADLNLDARLAHGALHDPGIYGTTITQPKLFSDYYTEQLFSLASHHEVPLVVGTSRRPIPLPYLVDVGGSGISQERAHQLTYLFPMPDLSQTDDQIANGTYWTSKGEPQPLAIFTAERVDYSLHRLYHYSGTAPRYFQRFILLTNYQRYIDHFIGHAQREVNEGEDHECFVEPGNVITWNRRFHDRPDEGTPPDHLPQMPAYHLCRPDGQGVTMINIGVGPSNARTITDHLAVLRPHCWLMLGHCAGLRRTQQLGDYVLAHGYMREDHVLDQEVPPFVPVPPIAEVQVALQSAVANVTGLSGLDLKTRMRTGTVATTANRNWELRYDELFERLNQSRAIAVDMESATIATNGLRFRVPYGTLLCVSDKPLHGEIKLRGMANRFYQERVNQHIEIGLEAIRLLREQGLTRLHSRKLRSFDEPAFR